MGKKFINPTDQARKEARRKELKKNKKQRQEVRAAVIKQKDPKHILTELDSLDKLEFDVNNPPPYSAKVIQEKRRKLKEQWKKIYQFYQKEDAKMAYELKMMEVDYENRHKYLAKIHDSIIQAQNVKLDDIPLPSNEQPTYSIDSTTYQIPFNMPPPPPPPTITTNDISQPKSILKSNKTNKLLTPPGPPPSSPPDLSEFHCDDDEFETGLTINEPLTTDKNKKLRFNNENLVQSINISTSSSIINQTQSVLYRPTTSTVGVTSQQSLQPPPPPLPPATKTNTGYSNLQMKIQQQASRVAQQIYQQSSIQQQTVSSQSSTIEAKPVLRNKIAEVTRFVPTTLLVKRDNPQQQHQQQQQQSSYISNDRPYDYMAKQQELFSSMNPLNKQKEISNNSKSTDAAYEDFMKEVSELL